MDPVPDTLRGSWSGDATIVVAWSKDDLLPVRFTIGAEGHVQGTIGGATLREGYLAKNRGDLGRQLGINTDYIVRGLLEGTVLAGEPFRSVAVFVPFNLAEHPGHAPRIEGGVTTSRSENGTKKEFVVAAAELRMRRHDPRFSPSR